MISRLEALISDEISSSEAEFLKTDSEIKREFTKNGQFGSSREKILRISGARDHFKRASRELTRKSVKFIYEEGIPSNIACNPMRQHLSIFADSIIQQLSRSYNSDAFNSAAANNGARRDFDQLREEFSEATEASIQDVMNGRAEWERIIPKKSSMIKRIISDIMKERWKIILTAPAIIYALIGKILKFFLGS